MSHHLQRLFLAPWLFLQGISAAVLLFEPGPAWAGGDITSLILSGGRARVVQVCVVCMILGLFIMMRKWTEDGFRRRSGPPSRLGEESPLPPRG